MSEDGEKDQEKDQQSPSRPISASARRKKRSEGSAEADDTAEGGAEEGAEEGAEDESDDDKAAARPVSKASRASRGPQGKASSGAGRSSDAHGKGRVAASQEPKGRPTPKRNAKSRQQESLFARIVRFLREVVGELKKVVWPTRKQMGTYTVVVLVFLAFMVALVFGLDYAFKEVVALVFGK